MKLKIVLALVVVAAAALGAVLVFAGGDDDGDNGDKQRTESREKREPADEDDPRRCSVREITPQTTKEGVCVRDEDGKVVRYANASSTLRLRDLNLKPHLNSVSEMTELTGPIGTLTAEDGHTFVLMELTWKNKTKKARRLNESLRQVVVVTAVGGSGAVARGEQLLPDSFFNSKPVPPDGTQRATMVFQMPEEAAKGLTLRGATPHLQVRNFDIPEGESPPDGVIRLWT